VNLRYSQKLSSIEAVISYLEDDPWTFGSGYTKAEMIKLLRRLSLTAAHQERLRKVVLAAVDGRDRREFRHYCRLAQKVDSPALRAELTRRLENQSEAISRHARWVLDYLANR
jgi:hypothetical protein